MGTRVAYALAILALAAYAQAESHHKEHYKPDKHLLREKKAKEHHAYFHDDDKQIRKTYKSYDGPHHEEKMQKDLAWPSEKRDDAWHKKDMHLQDLSYEPHKEHHSTHGQPPHHPKVHHSWSHHNGKHTTDHHKVKESSLEHGYLHKPHKATPSTSEEKPHSRPAQPITKSLQHAPKEHSRTHHSSSHNDESHQIHFLTNKRAKATLKDHYWAKNKKQKDKKAPYDKKQKPNKQHRKKLSRGELHKLW